MDEKPNNINDSKESDNNHTDPFLMSKIIEARFKEERKFLITELEPEFKKARSELKDTVEDNLRDAKRNLEDKINDKIENAAEIL